MTQKKDKRLKNGGNTSKIPRLTLKLRKELERFAPLEIACKQIGEELGLHKNRVAREYSLNGGRKFYKAEEGEKSAKERNERRKSNTCIITSEMTSRFLELVEKGETFSKIRKELKISWGSLCILYKKNNIPMPSMRSLEKEMEERLYVVEEQIKFILEQLEKK